MIFRKGSLFLASAVFLVLFSSQAQAHWCDDLWSSSYNIVVKPDSDTSPQNLYVQNNMGYQLINFKLTASGTGGAVTLTAPTLKVSGTLLPGERGTWKIASGSPAKIEDVTFSVSFGNTNQSKCYPTKSANAVMVVKTDGTLHPAGTPPGLDSPSNPGNGCIGMMDQARSLQFEAVADFEDVNTGLDKLMNLYCAGRGSFGSTDGVSQTYCKDATSTSCPTSKPTGNGSKYDYMHLWAAGELAVRKAALGARAAVFRARLQCGVNDGDVGFAGYATFILGYLGDDPTARAFLTTQAGTSGDLGTIAKAALYMMGDTAQKADVQAGVKASSVFVQAACAAALGIVDKDDATVTSALIPLVKWSEPDSSSEDGKGMFAAHILELVAFDRRGWVAQGVGSGAVSFYGETATGAGGNPGGTGGATGAGGVRGSGGAGGNKDASPGSDAKTSIGDATGHGGASGTGGVAGSGGKSGSAGALGSGGAIGKGGATGAGGTTSAGGATGAGGTASASGTTGPGGTSAGSGGVSGDGGSSGSGGDTHSGTTTAPTDTTAGCKCNLGGHAQARPSLHVLFMAGLAWGVGRRRRR